MVGGRCQIKILAKNGRFLIRGKLPLKNLGKKYPFLNQSGSLLPGIFNHNLYISVPGFAINP
jgi:hypothetical protein